MGINRYDQCECHHFRGDHVAGSAVATISSTGTLNTVGRCINCACGGFVLETPVDHVFCTAAMMDEMIAVGTGSVIALVCRNCGYKYRNLGEMQDVNRKRRLELEDGIAVARVRLPEIIDDVGGLAEW